MKKMHYRSVLTGFVAGALCMSLTFAGGTKFTASPSSVKLKMFGEEIPMSSPVLNVVKDNKGKAVRYVPLDELLDYMNLEGTLSKDGKTIAIGIDSKWMSNGMNNGMNNGSYTYQKNYLSPDEVAAVSEYFQGLTQEEADAEAIDLIQKTGNWRYVESYLPLMSHKGIDKVVKIYNSKHPNKSEHKKASDYYAKDK